MFNKEKSIKNYEKLISNMKKKGYKENKKTISIKKANIYAFLTAGPIILLLLIIFVMLNGKPIMKRESLLIALFLLIIPSTIIHELLHGLGWLVFSKDIKSIHFGILKEMLTPYCHCSIALKASHYYLGLLLPFITLGIIPSIISIFINSPFLLLIGLGNILLAGGDTTVACYLLKYRKYEIIDHPNECGFVIFEKIKN